MAQQGSVNTSDNYYINQTPIAIALAPTLVNTPTLVPTHGVAGVGAMASMSINVDADEVRVEVLTPTLVNTTTPRNTVTPIPPVNTATPRNTDTPIPAPTPQPTMAIEGISPASASIQGVTYRIQILTPTLVNTATPRPTVTPQSFSADDNASDANIVTDSGGALNGNSDGVVIKSGAGITTTDADLDYVLGVGNVS